MNWFKANKFLAGLLAVVILGGGALGYLVFTAKSHADESVDKYQQTSASLKSLKSLPIYPNGQNLTRLETQRGEHQERVDELLESLAGMAPTLEPATPEQFQDRLRETVSAFAKDAAAGGMLLPDRFYMGFDPYQGTPPRAEAAPYLARSLKAVDFILRQLLNARVTRLDSLDREPIPEESKGGGSAAPAAGTAATAAGKPGKPAAAGAAEILKKRTFQISFYAEQIATQKVLNAFTAEKKWFIIPRFVQVKNEKPAGPPKSDPNAPAVPVDVQPPAAPPPGVPAPNGGTPAPAGKAFEFIVGEEKINTTMLLEFLIFNQADAKAGEPKKGHK